MTDFLLELRCEEIPARMQAGARGSLEKLFREQMAAAGVTLGAITVWSTPRRLALIARDLPLATAAVSEEVKGPKTSAPPQALEGFLRKTGLTQDQLTERDGIYFAISEKPGRATSDVLAEAIPAIIRAFPWPKSQRWGAASISTESLRWVRPLSGIVALLGEDLVACEIGGIASGYATMGHRFHHHGPITIGSAADYAEKLRACHVIVDHAEREALIRTRAAAAAQAAGLVLVEDEGLVIENAGLTEWPVPLLGRFDEEYLEVPPEVIQLTARTNQKYFICKSPLPLAGGARGGAVSASAATSDKPTPNPSRKREGDLANAFICTANIEAADHGEAIIAGNRKVLAARLSDARFFWQQDRKHTLEEQATKLSRITFHEKLGTVADKVERVAKLARWLVEQGIVTSSPLLFRGGAGGGVYQPDAELTEKPHPNPSPEEEGLNQAALADQAELAARLCKADLVTEMVGEFPELQGLMGGYYARAETDENGLRRFPDAVADAIRDHYKPVGQGDDVPTAPVTVAVSLADKLDTLAGFFYEDMLPTGSKDPFALRRSALGVLALLTRNGIRLPIWPAVRQWSLFFSGHQLGTRMRDELVPFFAALQHFAPNSSSDFIVSNLDEMSSEIQTDAEGRGRKAIRVTADILDFFADRLKVQQREAGVRHDLIDAVFALGGEDDLVRLLARVHALQAFVSTEDGTNLLAGYKRAANILKKEGFSAPLPPAGGAGGGPVDLSTAPYSDTPTPNPSREREGDFEPAEQALIDALASAAPKAAAAVDSEDFAGAMAALATLRAPIDAFFENVTVNDADPVKRAARLGLLDQFRVAVHKVADFSRIEG
ncbi:MAG: glycine--tRNA ligase subunit beta [Novosphingobium sp.]